MINILKDIALVLFLLLIIFAICNIFLYIAVNVADYIKQMMNSNGPENDRITEKTEIDPRESDNNDDR